MERLLRPDKLTVLHSDVNAEKKFKYWKVCFDNFVAAISAPAEPATVNKLALLINYVEPDVYEYICSETTYEGAVQTLENLYKKPVNVIYARYVLSTRKQEPSQSLDSFLQILKSLAKPCQFTLPATNAEYANEYIRDAFISGISSPTIRQRLLEENKLSLSEAFEKARSIEVAQSNSQIYHSSSQMNINAMRDRSFSGDSNSSESAGFPSRSVTPDHGPQAQTYHPSLNAAARLPVFPKKNPSPGQGSGNGCIYCGNGKHADRNHCPARNVTCFGCQKKGHFQKVCRSIKSQSTSACIQATYQSLRSSERQSSPFTPNLASIVAGAPASLSITVVKVLVNKHFTLDCLIDTGSSDSFISHEVVKRCRLNMSKSENQVKPVFLAAGQCSASVRGYCIIDLNVENQMYPCVKLQVLDSLCSDMILGLDFMSRHKSLQINFGGSGMDLVIGDEKHCGLTALTREPPRLFAHLDSECFPIKSPSRKYSSEDRKFIKEECEKLVDEGICVPSTSPWRAQVIIAKDEVSGKKRLCIDYSQTINKFTHQDGYPLPNIHDQATAISKYKYYSHLDLTSAYHQIPLHKDEQIYTAFESCGNLLEFTRVPFGVTNGPAVFQREIDNCIRENGLQATYAYIDNVTIAGMDKEDHDKNLKRFMEVAKLNNFTFNESKSVICKESIDILGYRISFNYLRPDPERLKPLQDLPPPKDNKTLKRVIGLFAYYSNWIPKYSEQIRPLLEVETFPLNSSALHTFESLKTQLADATLQSIDENIPFILETDASDFAIAAILNQGGRPVAFFSRSLKNSEKSHPAIEKEACSIIEAIRKWKHFLAGKHFTLNTDQEAISFIFNQKKLTKIKNDKLIRWRCELSCYSFDIVHKPGVENIAADAMSRVVASVSHNGLDKLRKLHSQLAHPGATRLLHFVRSKNLPFSTDDVRFVVSNCSVCCKVKPQFFRGIEKKHLIKSLHPFDRLNVDFKGPLPQAPGSKNKYILDIVDEYSRFPFAFACPDMTWATVRSCLYQLFAVFGMPSYVHSDRGPSFMCKELKEFLHSHGIATSKTSPYNPRGNGQVEKYNGTIWKSIQLKLEETGLDKRHWERFLPDALHSMRSLLCTATNATPHERMFTYTRKTSSGSSLPVWLTNPGTVLLKQHVRASKYDPIVEEVDLIDANPNYAHVKLKSGVEKTVSLRDLAPAGEIKPASERKGSHGDSGGECEHPSNYLTAKTPILCIRKSPMINNCKSGTVKQSGECSIDTNVGQEPVELESDSALQGGEIVTRYGRESKPVNRYGI